MLSLKQGREPSMYTDINYLDGNLYRPDEVVHEVAARDCIRLAQHCYAKTEEYQRKNEPTVRSANEDAFYSMKDRKTNDLFNTEDFWWYHLSRMEKGMYDFADSIALYQREYQNKGKKFQGED